MECWAGGVATVTVFKIVQNQEVFTECMIASRRKEKCDKQGLPWHEVFDGDLEID